MVHLMMILLFAAPPQPAVEVKAAAASMAPDVKALVDRVQAFYEKTNDFTADFKQDYTYKAFKRTQSSSGKVTFAKPGMMRWDYLKPSARTFVLAREQVVALDPEAMTLTIMSMATSQLSASVTFLWGKGKLADDFSIAMKECKTCTGMLLEMTPLRPDPRFQRVLLEVDPKSATVLKSTVIDPDGSENVISFGAMQLNTGIDATKFKLEPTAGIQVIDYTKMKPAAPTPP